MGERCDIINDIADAMGREHEHQQWAEQNGYRRSTPNCLNCPNVASWRKRCEELERENQMLKAQRYNDADGIFTALLKERLR